MSRRIIIFIFIMGLTVTFFLKPQSKSNEVLGMPNFTVVTRTSTPAPQPPTSTPSNPKPNPTSPPSQDTATATAVIIQDTATPTRVPVTLVATPLGGFLPTAVSCGLPPTLQAKDTTRVRSGPSTEYAILGRLVYLETHPIVGRAADVEWWAIQYTNNEIGWVANSAVTVQGNISAVPTLTAPPLDGEPTTPEPLWKPTPNPDCPILPTATATAAVINAIEPQETATLLPTKTATPDTSATTEAAAEIAAATAEVTPSATATSVVPTRAETAVTQEETAQPTAAPLDGDNDQSAANALPCAPALIGLAVIGFLAFRRIF